MEEKKFKTREEELDELLKSGELHTMSECAYGAAIANTEVENTLDKKKDSDN